LRKFLCIRLLEAAAALFAITLIVFALTHLSGNSVGALLADDATQQQIDYLTQKLGLDQPLHVQYFTFLGHALQGDFGGSLKWRGEEAMQVVLTRLPATLIHGCVAMGFSIFIALPLGVVSAVCKGTWLDRFAQSITLLGQSIPSFRFGILLIWLFAVYLGWFPTSDDASLHHLILLAIAIAWFQIAALTRLTRSSMLWRIWIVNISNLPVPRVQHKPNWCGNMAYATRRLHRLLILVC